jgi:hypothetical protein
MVDVMFIVTILLGGPLVGVVAALVRGHDLRRACIEIAAAAAAGPLAAKAWTSVASNLVPLLVAAPERLSPRAAMLLSDIRYLSPVIGGFIAVAAVALVYRWRYGTRRDESWLAGLGDAIRVVGIVYLLIAGVLSAALAGLAGYQGRWDFVRLGPMLADLFYGTLLVLTGWAMTRAARSGSGS